MSGMDRNTGKRLVGDAHIRQSIHDIVTTPRGSRVMRRDYGSIVPALLDRPLNPATRQLLIAGTAGAVARWERRVRVRRVAVTGNAKGQGMIDVTYVRTDIPQASPQTLSIF